MIFIEVVRIFIEDVRLKVQLHTYVFIRQYILYTL